MRTVKRALLYIVGAWLLLCLVAYLLQRRMMYFPDAGPVPLPALPGLEEVTLTTSDGVALKAWHWLGKRPLTLLVFHGNAGHRGHRLDWIEGFHSRGWGVFLLDYRGYGGSSGAPSEQGFYKDADAAADYLGERNLATVYVGRSMGSGVAVDLAARRPPKGLIIDSGALSMASVAKSAYPFLPIGLLMKDRFDGSEKAGRIECPLLALHGEDDRIISMELGRKLFDAFGDTSKRWVALRGAGHNDIRSRAYFDAVHEFLMAIK